MIKVLVSFLEPETPYRQGDVVWIDEVWFKELEKKGKVKRYKEEMFYPLEQKTIVSEGKEVSVGMQKIKIPEIGPEEKLICAICGKKFKTIKLLTKHKEKWHKIKKGKG